MYGILARWAPQSARGWITHRMKRQELRRRMFRELNELRCLSDEHLRDVGLYRSEIEQYIRDLHTAEIACRPRR